MNVTHFHCAHGVRWVWDESIQDWIAPPRPRKVWTLTEVMRLAKERIHAD